MHPILAWTIGGPVFLFIGVPVLRGAVPLFSVAMLAALPFLLFGVLPLVLRRTAVLNAETKTITVGWGKPIFFIRSSRRWSDFAAVWVDTKSARRGLIYQVFLSGEAGRVLVTESRSESASTDDAARIASFTGLPG